MFKRIVVAIDGSDQSTSAFNLAASLTSPECEIHLVHSLLVGTSISDLMDIAKKEGFEKEIADDLNDSEVLPVAAGTPHGAAMPPVIIANETLQKFGQLLLDKLATKVSGKDFGAVHKHIGVATADKDIVDYAKNKNADLIVIGSRGHGKLKSLVLGSVSQSVIVEAQCPVLVAK
ncbi:MAG: universal stress protein [Rhodospirillaceae bacterium]